MKLFLAAFGVVALASGAAVAQTGQRPVLVELFTSQGCSSCPPADAVVAELARDRPDLLALTFHVTYWDGLGWKDPFSFQGATDRQRRYVALAVSPQVYTPAMVVDGAQDVIGSDRAAVAGALSRASLHAEASATLDLARSGPDLAVSVGAGTGTGAILLVGFDRQHQTSVGRGENSGRTLLEANVVRSLTVAGSWTGVATKLRVATPAGEEVAAILQADDGRILAVKRLRPF